jgi:hypothetical protein
VIGALVARKAVADAFEALNRHDLETFMSAWLADGAFIYPGEIAESGTARSKEGTPWKGGSGASSNSFQ